MIRRVPPFLFGDKAKANSWIHYAYRRLEEMGRRRFVPDRLETKPHPDVTIQYWRIGKYWRIYITAEGGATYEFFASALTTDFVVDVSDFGFPPTTSYDGRVYLRDDTEAVAGDWLGGQLALYDALTPKPKATRGEAVSVTVPSVAFGEDLPDEATLFSPKAWAPLVVPLYQWWEGNAPAAAVFSEPGSWAPYLSMMGFGNIFTRGRFSHRKDGHFSSNAAGKQLSIEETGSAKRRHAAIYTAESADFGTRRMVIHALSDGTFAVFPEPSSNEHITEYSEGVVTVTPSWPAWVSRHLEDIGWHFNKDASKAVATPFEALDALTSGNSDYKVTDDLYFALDSELDDHMTTTPLVAPRREHPGLLEVEFDIELTGSGPFDFTADATIVRSITPGSRYVLSADYAFADPKLKALGIEEDDMVIAELAIYSIDENVTETTLYQNSGGVKNPGVGSSITEITLDYKHTPGVTATVSGGLLVDAHWRDFQAELQFKLFDGTVVWRLPLGRLDRQYRPHALSERYPAPSVSPTVFLREKALAVTAGANAGFRAYNFDWYWAQTPYPPGNVNTMKFDNLRFVDSYSCRALAVASLLLSTDDKTVKGFFEPNEVVNELWGYGEQITEQPGHSGATTRSADLTRTSTHFVDPDINLGLYNWWHFELFPQRHWNQITVHPDGHVACCAVRESSAAADPELLLGYLEPAGQQVGVDAVAIRKGAAWRVITHRTLYQQAFDSTRDYDDYSTDQTNECKGNFAVAGYFV